MTQMRDLPIALQAIDLVLVVLGVAARATDHKRMGNALIVTALVSGPVGITLAALAFS